LALKPTIYKQKVALSDMDRDVYETLNLTIAQHPSETLERMMVRVLAYCLNAQENLAFTKGLSTPDEPDVWARSLDDQLLLWLDVGEPALDRIRKATRVAKAVKIYSFNSKSDVWWRQEQEGFAALPVSVYRVPWQSAQALAALVERTTDMSITVSGETAYVATDKGECQVDWEVLQSV
jgi:uncharacterized protein YaeQ